MIRRWSKDFRPSNAAEIHRFCICFTFLILDSCWLLTAVFGASNLSTNAEIELKTEWCLGGEVSSENVKQSDRLFRNSIFIASSYAVVLFACLFVVGLSEGRAALLMIPAVAIILATFELSAMWAVLGPGGFWRRSVAAFGMASLVGVMGLIGISATMVGELDFDAFLIGIVASLAVIPFLWLMFQLPFWCFRGLFGWYLGFWPGPTGRSPMTIRDMLAITGFIGVALAGIRLSIFPTRGGLEEADVFQGMAFSIIPLVIYSFATFLLFTMPALLLILRPEKQDEGCQWYAGLSVMILIVLLGGMLAFVGGGNGVGEAMGMFGAFLGLFCLAIGLPMMVLRDSNIILYSRRRERKWSAQPSPMPLASAGETPGESGVQDRQLPVDRPADPLGIEDDIES